MRAAPSVILRVLSAFLQIQELCKSKNQMVWQIVDQACRRPCHWFPEHQFTYSMTCWSKWDVVLSFRTACEFLSESYRIQVCVGSSFWNCYLLWLMTLALVVMNHQTVANNFSWWLNTSYLPTLGSVHIAHASPLSDLVGTMLEWAVTVGTGHALPRDFIWGMLVVVYWHGGTTYYLHLQRFKQLYILVGLSDPWRWNR